MLAGRGVVLIESPGLAETQNPTDPEIRCTGVGAMPGGVSIEFRSTRLLQVPDPRAAVATLAGRERIVSPSPAWPWQSDDARWRTDRPRRGVPSQCAARQPEPEAIS